MLRKIVGGSCIAAAVGIAVTVLLAVPSGVLALCSWALMGYLLWRAWPAVREDVRRLPALRLPSRFVGRHGGLRGRGGDL